MSASRANPALRAASRARARSWCRSPAGRCRSPTRGSARSTRRCARTPGCSTSPTWARSRSRGRGRSRFLQRVLSNDVATIELGGAQYSCLCNEEGGVLDDLFAYRLGGDRYLIVTNAANHDDRPRLARALEPRLRRRRPRRRRPLRDARRAGPARPRDRRARRSAIELPPRMHVAGGPDRRPPGARLRHRLHRRGRGRAADRPRGRAARSGPSCSTPASSPAGSAPATRCGSRSASTCTATT